MRYQWLSLIAMLALVALACSLPTRPPSGAEVRDGAAAAAETAAALATRAAPGLGTAAANVREAGSAAAATAAALATAGVPATAAARAAELGGAALATAEALATAGVPATVAAGARGTVAALPATYDALRDKMAAVLPDANGQISVTIDEAELTTALAARQARIEGDGETPALRGAVVRITPATVILMGELTTPIAGPLLAVFVPYVRDGVIQLDFIEATVAGITVPNWVVDSAEFTLNTTLNTALAALPSRLGFTAVTLSDGAMTLTGGLR